MMHLALVLTVAAVAAQPDLANLPHPDPAVVGVEAATQAYLDTVPADKRARSDAYFEGGYWLLLWRFLWSSLALLVLLHAGLSARLRDLAARVTRRVFLQPAIYWIGFSVFTALFALPLNIYADFVREHQYGLSTLTFGAWLGETGKALGVELVLGAIGAMVFYAALRRAGRGWWLWGTGVALALMAFIATIGPVFIAPIFNTYQPLRDASIRDPILSVARANGIHASEVWEMDASRQTTRISANVSGMLGTERITLNDNLLKRASRGAVLSVMGHEMGHYVLNHVYELMLWFGVLIAIAFAAIARLFPVLAARHAARWRIRDVADPAGLPLIVLLFGAYFFAIVPITNSIVRSNEYEADVFGVNASQQPEGFAEAALLLGDYRKLHPGPIEEMIFFDHPSGYTRIRTAMQWKAEHGGGPSLTRAAADPFTGTWTLNLAKSRLLPPAPRSVISRIECTDTSVSVREEIVDAGGRPQTATVRAAFDGTDAPIAGSPAADTVAYRRVDARTISGTSKKGGKVLVHETVVVAPDGRTMTATYAGADAEGKPVTGTAVFEKQVK